jgi:hypothetical protein
MRKNLIFLLAIFVCALGSTATWAQPESNSGTVSTFSATGEVDEKSNTLAAPPADIFGQIKEARRILSSRPASAISGDVVTLAALHPKTSGISVFSVAKNEFLVKDADLSATTQTGNAVRIHVVRANGVNTAVTVTDVSSGQVLIPLMVQFPIVKDGAITEMAYYASAHPALLSLQVTEAGQAYVRTMLDAAAQRLAKNGVIVPADLVDIAEHLCIVEHTDHKRFMNEDRTVLFPEILSLYALNQGNTYRYSVSSAGAGGMIQMIPRTYAAIREQHAAVSLQADFVDGMRNHSNALEAMLLYMDDTWNHLNQSPTVQEALRSGIATKPELMAAGYNSNPMKLPSYLEKGGAQWRTLIPTETQMYLAIYSSVNSTLQLGSHSTAVNTLSSLKTPATVAQPSMAATVLSWLGRSVSIGGPLLGRLLP